MEMETGGAVTTAMIPVSKSSNKENMGFKKITHCRICGSDDLFTYLDLPDSPLCNGLLKETKEDIELFEVKVLFCKECYLSQLSVVIDPEILYKDYVYHSSVSQTFKDHCYEMALTLKPMWKMHEKPDWFWGTDEAWAKKQMPRVMDIASNDGCLLREFRKAGFAIIGVEPSENFNSMTIIENKIQSGIDTSADDLIPMYSAFWSEDFAKSINFGRLRPWSGPGSEGCIDFITATNVFAHVDDIDDFLKGVNCALDENGVFVVEVPYLVNLLQKNEFDTVYHEHLSYFLVAPLVRLFAKHNLPIFRVEEHPIHGGSIRIYASRGTYPVQSSVEEMIDYEEQNGFYDTKKYIDFAAKTMEVAGNIQIIMNFAQENGHKVMGYGASAKGISLINYLGIGDKIHSIVDDTPAKQGKFTPGSNIPIVDFQHFEKEKPDYIFIMAWNFAEELMAKTKHLRAKYIIPIPEAVIV